MDQRGKEIVKTLLICLVASTTAAILKIWYGQVSGSLAFVADGVHSVSDSAATLIGMFSVAFSRKPPDRDHPYGHRKFEILSAMALGMLLFLAAYEVATMAYQRIVGAPDFPTFTWPALAILLGTMAINLGIAKFEARKARALSSHFLEADAIHNQSDFWITTAVLATVVCAHFRIPHIDALVSIFITLYLVFLSIRLIAMNIQPLVDHSVLDPDKVTQIVNSIEGVLHCHHVRSRGEKGYHFLDLNIHLSGQMTLEKAHDITHRVEAKLKAVFPGLVDVVIHTEPHDHPPEPVLP